MTQTASSGARLDYETFQQIIPEMSRGMAVIARAVKESGLEPELLELVKIRVSQLNGCAFCVQYHLNDARKLNIAPEKLDLVCAWREAGVFSEREYAALHWAERVTLLAEHHVSDNAFTKLAAHFSEPEIAFLTTAIGQINFWNRVAAPFRFTPPLPSSIA